jgi:hypothetical protein
MAHHSEDVMSDLNFFLGDENLTWFRSNHTYSSRATRLEIYSHVGLLMYCQCLYVGVRSSLISELLRWTVGTLWRSFGNSAFSLT